MDQDTSLMDFLTSCYIHHPKTRQTIIEPQFRHRINLCRVWGIEPGWRILDIGCGQGDATVVLAHTVGADGHVTAIDPASPTYGSPYTLGQAQDYIHNSALGSRVAFHRADAPSFVASLEEQGQPKGQFDAATLCHSLWYFSTRSSVSAVFCSLAAAGVRRICLAEYTGHARIPAQIPHELAARAQRRFHAVRKQKGDDGPNVREALEPPELVALAEGEGWAVKEQGVVEAPEGLLDGLWETQIVTDPSFGESVANGDEGLTTEQKEELLAYVPKIEGLVSELKGKGEKVLTMDVAWVILELKQ
jgi:ubiquinone/menaquinone biosynthesis C-methylase UbiE